MSSGTGLRDWVIQRATAVYLGVYTIGLMAYFLLRPNLVYGDWYALFQNPWMQVGTMGAMVSLVMHAWLGLWTIATDYIKCSCVRLVFLSAVVLALFGYLFWSIIILWG